MLASRQRCAVRTQQGTHGLAVEQAQQHIVLTPAGDPGRGTGTCGQRGRTELGAHATATERTARTCHRIERRISRATFADQLRARVEAGIGAEQTGLIGQDDQQLRLHQVGDQPGQRIVVTESNLVRGDRVVLVHDRHHIVSQQHAEGAARIEVAPPVRHILVGQEDLRRVRAVAPEGALIDLHQPHLPDRSQRL